MVINGFTMRKKIHYTMAILNFVLSLVMIFFFNRNTSDLMLEIFKENEMALKGACYFLSVTVVVYYNGRDYCGKKFRR